MRKIFYKVPFLNKIALQRNELLNRVCVLENEIKALNEEKSNKDDFQEIFLSPWTDSWKEFYVKNYNNVQLYLENLKKGMDRESQEIVDILWKKIIFLIPYNEYKKSFLYKTLDFFTENELREQKKQVFIDKYKFPENTNIENSIFYTKNGLSFLSDKITSQIKGESVIDGGGYIGDSALVFCEFNPSKVYSFEPVNSLHENLKETLNLNDVEKLVEPIKLGLSNEKKKVKIFGTNSAASLHTKNGAESQEINTTTIDEFVKEKNIKVGLIKLDVEGSELEAVKGALETIKKDKPILLISVYHRPEDFFFIKPLIDSLNVGYRFLVRKTSPFRVTSETVLIGHTEQK